VNVLDEDVIDVWLVLLSRVMNQHGRIAGGLQPLCCLLASLLAHRMEREAKILRALAGGPLTEDALREEVYKDTPGAAATLASRTLEAHLIKLIDEGKVLREGDTIRMR